MDWKALGERVADAAPILGTLLAGPQGSLVGGWIAKKFGTEKGDPSAIFDVMQRDAEWKFKLRELEVERETQILQMQTSLAIEELTAEVESLKAVNETMRAESSSEDPWQRRWRPFIGFVFGGAFGLTVIAVCYIMYLALFGGKPEAVNQIPNLVSTFTTLFAIPGAILGVTAWGRNQLKVKQLDAKP